jgi:hypothetical protein
MITSIINGIVSPLIKEAKELEPSAIKALPDKSQHNISELTESH